MLPSSWMVAVQARPLVEIAKLIAARTESTVPLVLLYLMATFPLAAWLPASEVSTNWKTAVLPAPSLTWNVVPFSPVSFWAWKDVVPAVKTKAGPAMPMLLSTNGVAVSPRLVPKESVAAAMALATAARTESMMSLFEL